MVFFEHHIERFLLVFLSIGFDMSLEQAHAKRQYDTFLSKYDNRFNPETPTPTSNSNIQGGSYSIPDDKYSEFLQLYYNYIVRYNNVEYLTEIQRTDGTEPIVVDLDLRYDFNIKDRQHTRDNVEDLVVLYLGELKHIYEFDEKPFYIFIMEKPNVNRDTAKKITKDGIHMIIGIQSDRIVQSILRSRVIKKIGALWNTIPLNSEFTWETVFDEGVTMGHCGWQMYGSQKPSSNEKYDLSVIYEVLFDPADREFSCKPVQLSNFQIIEKIELLSVRSQKHPSYHLKPDFMSSISDRTSGNTSPSTAASKRKKLVIRSSTNDTMSMFQYSGAISEICNIRDHVQLDIAVEQFKAKFASFYDIIDAHNYTLTLPESYYGPGSYDKWMRVGWALSNTHDILFLTWIAFSAQSSAFSFGDIPSLYDKWQRFDKNNILGLNRNSIRRWSEKDAPDKYADVRFNSIDYHIDKTLTSAVDLIDALDADEKKKVKGKVSNDYAFAEALHFLYGDESVCVSVKNNMWMRYAGHRWIEDEAGNYLRHKISTELHKIYERKMFQISERVTAIQQVDESDNRIRKEKAKLMRICQLLPLLGSSNDKKNIMTEARELFYDSQFMEKLDENPYLLCFNNGVFDFKQGIFRAGCPEDYISKSTNIDYVEYKELNKDTVAEIHDFMNKLFPKRELCKYMWDHLASVLIGTPDKQTFNNYYGEGRNGKSVLCTLMDTIMGEYKGVVPLSAITQDRAKIGGTSAELAELKAIRYAVIMEPSESDAIKEGPLKQLTSGLDPIQCRAPYSSKTMTYYPQFKLVLCTNHLMEVKAQDNGTWRRIRVVPFESLFTENPVYDDPDKPYQYKIDDRIHEKFDIWKTVFMSMLVQHAKTTGGSVQDCEVVLSASREYQQSQDFIAEFVRDKIVRAEGGKIGKSELNTEFHIWFAQTYGNKGLPNIKKVHTFVDKTYGKAKNNSWTGIKIRFDRDDMLNQAQIDDDDDYGEEHLMGSL
jgi:P4 family phage/plasmid primase-like protien